MFDKPRPCSVAETRDKAARVSFSYDALEEMCVYRFGVHVSAVSIRQMVQSGIKLLNKDKHLAATVVVTDAMIELARTLNSHLLKSFKALEFKDLLPGATDIVLHEGEKELMKKHEMSGLKFPAEVCEASKLDQAISEFWPPVQSK